MIGHIAVIDTASKDENHCGCIRSVHTSVDDALLVWERDDRSQNIRRVPKHYRIGEAVRWVDATHCYYPEFELQRKADAEMRPLKFGL